MFIEKNGWCYTILPGILVIPHHQSNFCGILCHGPLFRSLSDVQEAAQLLAGKDVPIQLLQSVLSKTKLKQAAVVNATPYDCYLEKVCLEYHKDHDVSLAHLSVSLSPSLVDYVQKVLAMELLQVWFLTEVKPLSHFNT